MHRLRNPSSETLGMATMIVLRGNPEVAGRYEQERENLWAESDEWGAER